MPSSPMALATLAVASPRMCPSIIIITPVASNTAGTPNNTYSHFLIPIYRDMYDAGPPISIAGIAVANDGTTG